MAGGAGKETQSSKQTSASVQRKLQFGKQVLLYPEERNRGSRNFSCFNGRALSWVSCEDKISDWTDERPRSQEEEEEPHSQEPGAGRTCPGPRLRERAYRCQERKK